MSYDNLYVCIQCQGTNSLTKTYTDGGIICEAATKCDECAYEGYWGYGYHQVEPPEEEMTSQILFRGLDDEDALYWEYVLISELRSAWNKRGNPDV